MILETVFFHWLELAAFSYTSFPLLGLQIQAPYTWIFYVGSGNLGAWGSDADHSSGYLSCPCWSSVGRSCCCAICRHTATRKVQWTVLNLTSAGAEAPRDLLGQFDTIFCNGATPMILEEPKSLQVQFGSEGRMLLLSDWGGHKFKQTHELWGFYREAKCRCMGCRRIHLCV